MTSKLVLLQQVHNLQHSKQNIGLALIDSEYAELGMKLIIEIRNKRLKAVTVATPFYKREK